MRRHHGQGCRTHGRVGGQGLGCVRVLLGLLAGNVKRQGWWAGLTGETWAEQFLSKKKLGLGRCSGLSGSSGTLT
jgi:hypothetical protein